MQLYCFKYFSLIISIINSSKGMNDVLDIRYVIWYWKFLFIKRLGALNILRMCMLKEDTTIWVVINHTRIPCILINFDMQEFCGKMQRVNESSLIAQNIISKALSHIENNGGMYRSFWRHKWFYAVLFRLLRQNCFYILL